MLAEEPGLSAAELARAMGTTPQAANVLVARMESEQLVYREAHPTHGRILEIDPTKGGLRRPDAALPFIRRLETQMCEGLQRDRDGDGKRWLVESARRLSPTRARQTLDGQHRRHDVMHVPTACFNRWLNRGAPEFAGSGVLGALDCHTLPNTTPGGDGP